MEQEIEEDASEEERHASKVQAVQESEAEDDAFREEQSFDRAHAAGPSLGVNRDPEVPSEAAAQHQEEVRHVLWSLADVWMHHTSGRHQMAVVLSADHKHCARQYTLQNNIFMCHQCLGTISHVCQYAKLWAIVTFPAAPAGKQGDNECR